MGFLPETARSISTYKVLALSDRNLNEQQMQSLTVALSL